MPDSPIADPLAWRPVNAPSLLDLEILASTVFRDLPAKFRTLCEGLVIRVEDFATDEVLDDMEIDTGIDLDALIDCARIAQDIVGRELPSALLHAGARTRRYES